MLLPFNFLVSSSGERSRSLLADCSLHVLLILTHYYKCVVGNEPITDKSNDTTTSNSLLKGSRYLSDNPYCKALEHATDVEFDRVDTEGTGSSGPVLRLPYCFLVRYPWNDVYLHTTCLATSANMAPHVHRLSAYASQRLVSLFDTATTETFAIQASNLF